MPMNINKVVAITLYRRPEETIELLHGLTRCYDFENYQFFISCDYHQSHHDMCLRVQALAQYFENEYPNQVNLWCHHKNVGIDLNKLFLMPEAYKESDYVILLEDDTPIARDGLRWFHAMGEWWAETKSIISVSGYSRYPEPIHEDLMAGSSHSYHAVNEFKPWGFGMWKDRYERFVGLNGQKYLDATGDKANGMFDHNLSEAMKANPNLMSIFPYVGRTNHVGGTRAEHTPSETWLMENEYAVKGAWSQPMPDPGPEAHVWST